MDQQLIELIVNEIRSNVTGKFLGKIFQLTPFSFALDLGLRGSFLLISVDPSSPRLYLIQRRVKDLEKQAIQLTRFGQILKSTLAGAQVVTVDKEPSDRVARVTFRVNDDLGATHLQQLIIQLTGRSSNLFLADALNRIVATLRSLKGAGQQPEEIYCPPTAEEKERSEPLPTLAGSPSANADAYFSVFDAEKAFDVQANALRSQLRKFLAQKRRTRTNLENDLVNHGDPDQHKKIGDLLLANVATAVRSGNKVSITDYYSDGAPLIEIEVDKNTSLQDEAAQRFRLYTKAKRASEEIAGRLVHIEREIAQLEKRAQDLEFIIRKRDEVGLQKFDNTRQIAKSSQTKPARSQNLPGVRRYVSTDGYEILVGRAARDNDNLTFRLAQPHDMWMHAGDYPGSHVVVRNPTRKEIPQRTIIEAAQLAGRFSQASKDSKVVVHYTQRKFLSKPKGAAPGLVRMSSFRSITVEPKEAVERVKA